MQTACNLCKDQKITDDPKCTNCGVRCSSCCQMDGSKFKKDPCPSTCGFRERLFKGTRAAVSFCETVFTEQYKNGIVMSHNGSGYDNYFLIEWMISNSIRPQVVFNGSKIVYMLVQRGLHIRVLDSLQFLPMKLAKLPKAFGLTELKKGYFPHFFNTTEHQNYVGPYPDVKYYGCDYMNTEDRTDFLAWYEGKKDAVFDFAQEMKEYCCSDVTILREGMLKFRDLVLDVTGANDQQGVDVLNYVTIAGLTMAIYKSKFLREEFDTEITNQQNEHIEWKPLNFTANGFDVWDEGGWTSSDTYLTNHPDRKFGKRKFVRSPIAHVPSEGYTKRYNHSKCSIVWLEWIMQKENKTIQHALNGGEYRIPGTKFHVDGYCKETNEVFEFLGVSFFLN